MPAESLVPGYRLVERFGPDSAYETRPSANAEGTGDEEEVEEEVEYVTLEISGIADVGPDLLTSYRLIVSLHGRTVPPCCFRDSEGRLILIYPLARSRHAPTV